MERYKERFPNFYKLGNRVIELNKISHAYLFVSDVPDLTEIAVNFGLNLIYNNSNTYTYSDIIEGKCPDIKIVFSDGLWIKKESIVEIQEEFKNKSISNNKRIYIISEADKLNKTSGNRLLKFLEEPDGDVTAILLTKNKNLVLDTLVSRCQCIYLKEQNKSNDNLDNLVVNEETIGFFELIEKNQLKSIIYMNEFIKKVFVDRDNVIKIMNELLIIYYKYLRYYMYGLADFKLNEQIVKDNNVITISNKIKIIDTIISDIRYNTNIKLTFDRLIIGLYGGD